MGVPYEHIYEWKDVFVGTLFVANGSVINATTISVATEPMGSFNLTTFVENASGIFVREIGEHGQIEFAASSNFFNLTDTTPGVSTKTLNKTLFSNGTSYVGSYNTTNKNGTFLVSLYNPYAEKSDGQRINVSVIAGQAWVSPRYDISGAGGKPDFVVNIIDLTIMKQHYGEIIPAGVEPPRYDINKDRIVNIIDLTILKQHYGEIIPTV